LKVARLATGTLADREKAEDMDILSSKREGDALVTELWDLSFE